MFEDNNADTWIDRTNKEIDDDEKNWDKGHAEESNLIAENYDDLSKKLAMTTGYSKMIFKDRYNEIKGTKVYNDPKTNIIRLGVVLKDAIFQNDQDILKKGLNGITTINTFFDIEDFRSREELVRLNNPMFYKQKKIFEEIVLTQIQEQVSDLIGKTEKVTKNDERVAEIRRQVNSEYYEKIERWRMFV